MRFVTPISVAFVLFLVCIISLFSRQRIVIRTPAVHPQGIEEGYISHQKDHNVNYSLTDAYGPVSSGFSCHIEGGEGVCTQDGREVQRCTWLHDKLCAKAYPVEDTMMLEQPKYLPEYVNPCWIENITNNFSYERIRWHHHDVGYLRRMHLQLQNKYNIELLQNREENRSVEHIRCLPFFYIIGVAKSGTTDLFRNILEHPLVTQSVSKEIHFWTRRKYSDGATLKQYTDLFDGMANRASMETDDTGTVHPLRVGEGSVSTLNENRNWRCHKENICAQEPRIVTPSYILHIQPSAKFIAILRNPVDRLYSDFYYFKPRPHNPSIFHRSVTKAIQIFKECTETRSDRACVYEHTVLRAPIEVTRGLYYIYINDWLKVVPRDQLYIILTEDWVKDRQKSLEPIMSFLGLVPINKQGTSEYIYNHHDKGNRPSMWDATKKILYEFYQPYNVKLAQLLNHEKYLWES